MWEGEPRVRVFLGAGSRSLLGRAAPLRAGKGVGHPEEAAPDLRPGVPGRVRAWQEGSWGTASPGAKANSLLPAAPHPQHQLQKVGRAPANVRPDELPAPNQAGRSKGLGPHPPPGPQHTHRYTLTSPPALQLREKTQARPKQPGALSAAGRGRSLPGL